MAERYIVVDGSNIATEGRETPSLAQLDEAVRAFMQSRAAGEEIIVVVDATFGHRIDPREKAEYEQAERAGELVSPPAGAIGRGDAFLLQVADRTNAVVLSNDSFQEFHAEYPWLFDDGRLIGGKPVPKVGWFFTPRTPVRGPKSREAMRAAKKARKASLKRAVVAEGPVAEAIAEATAEAISPDLAADMEGEGDGDGEESTEEGRGRQRIRRRRAKPVGAVNDPLPFIQFIADHPLGTEVEGEVDSFTSHGAFVKAGDARCYVPLSALGDPAPRSAKSVLTRGEVRAFIVQALDPPRRGIELAMPGMARVAGTPTEETVEADIGAGRKARSRAKVGDVEPALAAKRSRKKAAAPPVAAEADAEAVKPRRSRKAAAAEVAEAAEAAGAAEAEAAEAEPVVQPSPARRARKAKPPVESEAEVAAAPAPAAAAAAAAEPTPTRPRRARKAAAPVPAPIDEAPAPAPPRRARKKAAAEPMAAAPVAAEPVGEPVPVKARRSQKAAAARAEPAAKATRKRAAAKKAAAEGEAGAAPAPVKRARKKSAG